METRNSGRQTRIDAYKLTGYKVRTTTCTMSISGIVDATPMDATGRNAPRAWCICKKYL